MRYVTIGYRQYKESDCPRLTKTYIYIYIQCKQEKNGWGSNGEPLSTTMKTNIAGVF